MSRQKWNTFAGSFFRFRQHNQYYFRWNAERPEISAPADRDWIHSDIWSLCLSCRQIHRCVHIPGRPKYEWTRRRKWLFRCSVKLWYRHWIHAPPHGRVLHFRLHPEQCGRLICRKHFHRIHLHISDFCRSGILPGSLDGLWNPFYLDHRNFWYYNDYNNRNLHKCLCLHSWIYSWGCLLFASDWCFVVFLYHNTACK